MADRNKKPGKNSCQQGRKQRVPTPDWVKGANGLPSPFLRAGFDIGMDLSVPRQRSPASPKASNAPGQAAATTPARVPVPITSSSSSSAAAAADSSKLGRSSGTAQTAKSRVRRSTKKAPTSRAAPVTPKKPKTGARSKVTPSKRTHEDTFPDYSYYSASKNKDKRPVDFDSDSDNASYKRDDSSDYMEHRSDEEDDPEKREHEYGFREEDDDDDEYSKYYDGDDYRFKKQRR
ncbi:hypothetical protein VPNG_04334 [Cytospora leucostoma]|uniref:Uncharacterized protein n=1 Tax=Cytospora leucostoma TaxID=1230097 RepID=A0A423XDM1_9PEZI|nr:hypothetical protein VPNG_04334 [Cytospora leucostoma]